MNKFLLLALCALFALNAEARTLYVDASRPNNNGSGLSKAKAKKTIQAAVNIARAGDTILVKPGAYAPIKTKNRKITIKSVKGAGKTAIAKPAKETETVALANLGKSSTYVGTVWRLQAGQWYSDWEHPKKLASIVTTGTSTTLVGFTLDGRNRPAVAVIGISGGTAKSCTVTGLTQSGRSWGPFQATACVNGHLTQCVLKRNQCLSSDGGLISNSTLLRCRIQSNECGFDDGRRSCPSVSGSKLCNCLVVGNAFDSSAFAESTLLNCTVADNVMEHESAGVSFSAKSKFFNCILRDNYGHRKDWTAYETVVRNGKHEEWGYFDADGNWVQDEDEDDEGYEDEHGNWIEYEYQSRTVDGPYTTKEYVTHTEPKKLHNVDAGNVYKNTDKTNKNPKLTSAYKLRKGSYCINSGKLTKAQKKLVGTKDLAGRKRIRGKAIDRGCYEY